MPGMIDDCEYQYACGDMRVLVIVTASMLWEERLVRLILVTVRVCL